MRKVTYFPTHNTLTFVGKKLKPFYAKSINDAMYEMTGLEGLYKYDARGSNTLFTIYPESFDFGDDPIEFQSHLEKYKEIYEYVISNHPESHDF